jgi:hypothetical protein
LRVRPAMPVGVTAVLRRASIEETSRWGVWIETG